MASGVLARSVVGLHKLAPMLGSPEARALHAHTRPSISTPTRSCGRAGSATICTSATSRRCWRAAIGGHVDLPRMREGGMGAQFFGLVSLPVADGCAGSRAVVHEQIDALDAAIARRPGDLRLVRTAAEIDACRRDGAIGALLGIEGAHALEGDLDKLDAFARRGVRYLGLLHFSANEAGFPAYGRGRRDDAGPDALGLRSSSSAARQRGVIVDLAHINRRGFLDACARRDTPPIVSHTGVLGAFEHWRNIDDEQLRAVADKGGVVGVIFCPRFLGARRARRRWSQHIKHILDVVGEDGPALGSDWDGFIVPTQGPRRSARPAAPHRRAPAGGRRQRAGDRQDPPRERDARARRDLRRDPTRAASSRQRARRARRRLSAVRPLRATRATSSPRAAR